MLRRDFVGLSLVVAFACFPAAKCEASEHCCARCGSCCPCQKICRLVCEEKKVEIICWGCQCEDFCVPGPSCPVCEHCECICGQCGDKCDCKKPYAKPKAFVWWDWKPSCAEIFTKKKLMQKKITKKVPSYKWVVEDLCPACQANCAAEPIKPGVEVPPPPTTDAKIIPGKATPSKSPKSKP